MVKEANVSFGQGAAPKRGVTAGEVELMIAEYQAAVEGDVSLALEKTNGFEGSLQIVSAQLAGITKLPKDKINVNKSISSAFPSVTLSQVQVLDAQATLSDSADWYVLQFFLNEAKANKTKTLRIPEGTYYLSRGLDFSGLEYGTFINCEGVILKAISNIGSMILLKHLGNYWKGRRITIRGLEIRGDYKTQIGIEILEAQEFFLPGVKIHECFVGLSLADTWYGEISEEAIIQNCLVGVDFAKGAYAEVNTIGIFNLKINIDVPKTNFIPKNAGESDVDYDNRVETIGITLGIIIGGINFNSIIVEGMDYVFKYKATVAGTGIIGGIFSVKDGYFEAIKKRYIDFSEAKLTGFHQAMYQMEFTNNRLFSVNVLPSVLAEGTYRITGNQKISIEFIQGIRNSRLSAVLDNNVTIVKQSSMTTQMFIRRENIPADGNANRYQPYGDTSIYPSQTNMLPTIQDYHGIEHTARLRGNARAMNPYVLGVHTKPLTFIGNEHPAGPVIRGEDGKYYMMSTKDGSNMVLKEVKNINFLEPPVNSRTAKELYKRTSTEGDVLFCIEIEQDVTYTGGKWKRGIGTGAEVLAIGKSIDFVTAVPTDPNRYGSPSVWNVQINQGYAWQGTYWGWGNNVLGTGLANVRAIGTLAQRPVNPAIDGFIYYSTDEVKYYKWSVAGSAYSDYTPIF